MKIRLFYNKMKIDIKNFHEIFFSSPNQINFFHEKIIKKEDNFTIPFKCLIMHLMSVTGNFTMVNYGVNYFG